MWQVPYNREEGGYGVELKDELPVSVTSASPHAKVSQNCVLRLVYIYTVGCKKKLLGMSFHVTFFVKM